MDLRAPKLVKYLDIANQAGVSNYVIDDSITVKDIILPAKDNPNLAYVLSGIIPPNPSELLLSPRIEELFNELKEEYDYIIVDNAPTALVADVVNIARYADVFLYVVRANHLNKRDLEIPRKMLEEKEIKKMAFILNATKYGFSIYKGYGYGYGYGYGSQEVYGEKRKSWLNRWLKKS